MSLLREALIKMKNAFEQNVKMGDPQSVNGQLSENSLKLEKLQTDLKKYQTMLQDVLNNINCTPSSQKKSHSSSISSNSNLSVGSGHTPPHRNSISDESLSRSESENSVNNTNGHHHYHASTTTVTTIASTTATPSNNKQTTGAIIANGHLNNGHVNGISSLFKLNGLNSGAAAATPTTVSMLSPIAIKTPNTLSPYSNATAKDENDS